MPTQRSQPPDTSTPAHPETEAEELMLRFAELGTLLRDAIRRSVRESGGDPDLITNSALRLLLRLDLDGAMRPGEIQTLTGLSSGGVTKLLDRLECGDLIERRRDISGDGRGVGVHITGHGHDLVEASAHALESWLPDVQRVVKDFTTRIDASF